MGIIERIFGSNDKSLRYAHAPMPALNAQDFARRAAFLQFQTYPANSVAGAGTLVTQNGFVGQKYWKITQPPQVYVDHRAVTDSLLAAGTLTGGIYGAPLVPNPDSTGLS